MQTHGGFDIKTVD